ncbi:uncharacterized protein LOC115752715 isoform X2 [Rhodamnia argentea]|uniref:Uncharacterized protein LOC115752715 isoform X2 n=1 Tax=Rhodamnia argentea TaxID=178133 RepID=A0A8B8QIJ8_9MYRT|nr:uncharacterized protein LOC115752715 isoform X2 [Rhodamnia argentea]
MVHLPGMADSCRKGKVKFEVDDQVDQEQLAPSDKRPKLNFSPQSNLASGGVFGIPPEVYNPLDEPSPLGLRLKKSESFVELVQMKLSQEHTPKSSTSGNKAHKGVAADKLKASNFPASVLKIGTWEYRSRYEGDLVAKCYFAKHKLVWEVLDGALKNKIEIQWSDIVAIKADYSTEGNDNLYVVLARQPLFFRETNPQPRKHTLWQPTSDFTNGQASMHRRHFVECPQGLLGRHFEKLVQCDPRLHFLSQQPEIVVDSPYFDTKISLLDKNEPNLRGLNVEASSLFAMAHVTSPTASQLCPTKREQQDFVVVDSRAVGEMGKAQNLHSQIEVPGLRCSMSVSDLVSHIGHCITERSAAGDPLFSAEELQSTDIMEDITRYLFSDSQVSATDEQAFLSRVNSLCSLLQKDDTTAGFMQTAKKDEDMDVQNDSTAPAREVAITEERGGAGAELKNESTHPMRRVMLRNDSVGELLLNLPRIASLPHILWEDSKNQSR